MVFGKIRLSTILIIILVVSLYFATRLINIMGLPLFTDEAIYVRWSQIAHQDAAWRFISLTDGKQPLFIWIAMNIMRRVTDPLLAARLVSVFAGFATLIGITLLTLEIFKKKRNGGIINQIFGHLLENKRIGLIVAILYVLYPFALVYDRMALYDSLVACVMVWALFIEVLLVRYVRLDLALILGVVMGSAVLTKTSGFFSLYLLPFSLLIFDFKKTGWRKKIVEWMIYAIIAGAVAYIIYMVLRLSPFFYIVDEKNALFVYPFKEWLKHPFTYALGNFKGLTDWLLAYISLPILFLFFLSFFLGKKYFMEKLLLLAWFAIPFIALGIFGKLVYPRFILFMTMPILVLSAYSINFLFEKIKNKLFFFAFFTAVVSFFAYSDYFIITDLSRAPIASPDLGQYINSWPAGGGVKEMVSFFDQESKKGKIYVATQGTFGSLPTYALEIYLNENKNIEKRGIYPLPSDLPRDLKEKASKMNVYFVFNDSEDAPPLWPLTLVAKYQKGIGDRHMSIYKVNP